MMTPDEIVAVPPPVYPVSSNLGAYATRVKVLGILFAVFCLFNVVMLVYFSAAIGTAMTDAAHNAPAGSRAASQSAAQQAGVVALLSAMVNATRIGGAVLSLIAAVGLLGKQAWGRIATIIVSIPMLILFPIGTVLAAYAIYLMVKNGSKELYASLCASKSLPAAV